MPRKRVPGNLRAPNGNGTVYEDKRRGVFVGELTVRGKRVGRVTGATRTEARKRLDELVRVPVASGAAPASSRTFADWTDEYLGLRAHTASRATLDRDRSYLETHVVPVLGSRRLRDLTVSDINAMLLGARHARSGGPLSRNTLSRLRHITAQVLTEARRQSLVVSNVAELATVPTLNVAPPRPRIALSPAELVELLDVAAGDELGTYFATTYELALAPGESAALRWSSVDLDAGTVHAGPLRRTAPTGELVVGAAKNLSRPRTLRLTPAAHAALVEQRHVQLERRLAAGADWHDLDLVFSTSSGRMLDAGNVRRSLRRLCELAGVPEIDTYELRHTRITHLSDAGVRLEHLADIAGHADTRMIMTVYRHSDRVIDVELPPAASR
jgi:integrase